jgi:membrane-associated phospholipid phosphatase
MPDYLLQLDRQLFHFVNHDMANPLFDWLMPWLRTPKFWIPLYIFILVYSIWKFKWTGVILIAMLLTCVGVADFGSATIIKKQVQRLRPCNDPVVSQTDINRVPCGTGFSFPSTHATDHFAIAVFLSVAFFKKWRWIALWALLWAASVSFAQIYVGVHYPVDVLCGAILGAIIGWLFALLFRKLKPVF